LMFASTLSPERLLSRADSVYIVYRSTNGFTRFLGRRIRVSASGYLREKHFP
jgi:hypothetical protein